MNLGNQDITTVRNIKEIFQDIATRHYQINTFGWGKNADIGVSEIIYPVLWVQPINATMVRSESNDRYTSIEVIFNVKLLDLVKKDKDDNIDVTSETLQSLTDIINEFNDHPFYQYKNMRMVGDISFDEVEEYSDDQTNGWEANLIVKMRNITSWCGIPAQAIINYNNVTPQGFTATTFSQTDYYTTGGTITNGIISFDRNDLLSAYTVDINSLSPDLSGYIPYTGATKNVDLGSNNLHIGGNVIIDTIMSGSPIINLGLDSSGNVVTGTTGGGTFTGGTVTGTTIFTDGLTVNIISATTYQNLPPITISASLDGQGNVITTGSTGYRVVERSGNISHWYVIGNTIGSTIFDIKRNGTSIIGAGNKPTLTSQMRNDATPSLWTSIAIAANDELEFVVDAATTITKAWLYIQITKS